MADFLKKEHMIFMDKEFLSGAYVPLKDSIIILSTIAGCFDWPNSVTYNKKTYYFKSQEAFNEKENISTYGGKARYVLKKVDSAKNTSRNYTWQDCGGSMTIPEGWFIIKVDCDVDPPYCMISSSKVNETDRKVFIPRPLAYYLSHHFCGSEKMLKVIQDGVRYDVRNTLKRALLWDS